MAIKPTNILLIGCGYHAQRIYYPVIEKYGAAINACIVGIVDLKEKERELHSYFEKKGFKVPQLFLLDQKDVTYDYLSRSVKKHLDKIVSEHEINAIIIATEPLAHMVYARWALDSNLSILMDKPVSTKENISTDIQAAHEIISDYNELISSLRKAREKNPRIVFDLMAQRRYHSAFQLMKSLIKEVYDQTHCPVTSIQSFHSDGQWRMPAEIVEQNYHPYNQGYGKCSHSGYHSLDIVPWLMEAAEDERKYIDNVDVYANFLRPNDFISQITVEDYQNLFPNYDTHCPYPDHELFKRMENFGEIDAFNSFAFKHGDRAISLATVNLVHSGFAQRNWVTAAGRDLYKGNGRVRHESHYILQGPFQAISFISYQGKEIDPNNFENIYDVGGEYHLDIHVFRNDKMFPQWKNYEKYSVKDLGTNALENNSRGHQEDARKNAIVDFINQINGTLDKSSSPLEDHRRSAVLLSGVYQSACSRYEKKNPVINLNFNKDV